MKEDIYNKPNQHYMPVLLQQGFLADISIKKGKKGCTYRFIKKIGDSKLSPIKSTLAEDKTYQDIIGDLNADITVSTDEHVFTQVIKDLQEGKINNLSKDISSKFLKHHATRAIAFRKEIRSNFDYIKDIVRNQGNFEEIIEYILLSGDYSDFVITFMAIYLAAGLGLDESMIKSELNTINEIVNEIPKHLHLKLIEFLQNSPTDHYCFEFCDVFDNYNNLILPDCGLIGIKDNTPQVYTIFDYIDKAEYDFIFLPIANDKLLVWHNGIPDTLQSYLEEDQVRTAAFCLSVDECIAAKNNFPDLRATSKKMIINNPVKINKSSDSSMTTDPLAKLVFQSYGTSHESRIELLNQFLEGKFSSVSKNTEEPSDAITEYFDKYIKKDVVTNFIHENNKISLKINSNLKFNAYSKPTVKISFWKLKRKKEVISKLKESSLENSFNLYLRLVADRMNCLIKELTEEPIEVSLIKDTAIANAGCYIVVLEFSENLMSIEPSTFLVKCFVLK